MNKKIAAFTCVVTFSVMLFSCRKDSFLGAEVDSGIPEEQVFKDSAATISFLTNIYSGIGFSESPTRFGSGGLDASSSEAEIPSYGSIGTSIQFASGTINPSIVSDDAWRIPYGNIRSVNKLLKNLPGAPIVVGVKNRLRAEARFLRAWYYFILLKHYGGIPIIGDTLYKAEDLIDAKRSSFEESVNYIVAECNAAATDLPTSQTGLLYGRASRGACLALKSRLLLYAASPLFNGPNAYTAGLTDDVKKLLQYSTADPERWRLAAEAARELIASGVFQLYKDNATAPGYGFVHVFTMRYNTEYILPLMRGDNRDLEFIWWPPSRMGNGNGSYPYQEFVDAFDMADGKPITDITASPAYDAANPYANRDPRLNYSVIHNQSLMKKTGSGSLLPVNTFLGPGQDQDAVTVGTPTGYYTNKMVDPNVSDLGNTFRCLPMIRYAEVLLNFAEAANEYGGYDTEVYTVLLSIRDRAGIKPGADNMYGLKTGMTKDEMRAAIRHERQIELAFEGHWFWDVRRWMIADQTENRTMKGVKIIKDNGGNFTYNVFDVRKHNFRKAMYLWPIPQAEVGKSSELVQNPWY